MEERETQGMEVQAVIKLLKRVYVGLARSVYIPRTFGDF
jgi:hypothetical protein